MPHLPKAAPTLWYTGRVRPTACPSVDLLAAFIVGELPAAELEPLEVHFDACEECVCVVHAACPDQVTSAELLEHYEVLELIGRGGMGTVYRARDRRTGQLVAVKRMAFHPGDQTLAARYRREVDVLLRINHPNIVGIEDYGVENGGHYIVMEYVAGGSLRQHMDHALQWPVERVLELIIELADALARVHQLGVIHRDVKPENILVGADGKPRLADFGLVKINEARLTATGGVPGTLAYLSPEALSGDAVDGRADVWSLGLVAFELLTGQHPFRGNSPAQTLGAILHRPLPELGRLRPDLPQSVIDVTLRMLEKDCSRRIASARRVAADLETALTALR
ncbi:MAG TPA: protein kinase, partial [Polyangiaceae bacterium]|nr:protein kinase [Polyangiaceae bacterium]